MTKYVLAYHGGGPMPESAEETEKIMAQWGAWFQGLGASLVDPGNPLTQARTVASNGSASDGGGVNPLTGYSIINADSIDAAVDVAKGCPVLAGGGNVEVAEAIEI